MYSLYLYIDNHQLPIQASLLTAETSLLIMNVLVV